MWLQQLLLLNLLSVSGRSLLTPEILDAWSVLPWMSSSFKSATSYNEPEIITTVKKATTL